MLEFKFHVQKLPCTLIIFFIATSAVTIIYSARCTNTINNNNNINVYILTSSQFQTAHNHHKFNDE
jgi:hypothetical protein